MEIFASRRGGTTARGKQGPLLNTNGAELQMNAIPTQQRRRSTGIRRMARALWYVAPGRVELRPSQIGAPPPGHALVRTMFTGISRGTERLVHKGAVGAGEWDRMRAPLQEGKLPFPVKYGYCAVGEVVGGHPDYEGRTVFCLHPHQDWFIAPVGMLALVPGNVTPARATLAANMETALNALWDSGAGPADRIVVVGAGVLGLLVAYIASRMPGANVTVVDTIPERRALVDKIGARFASPTDAPRGADVVFHTSVSSAGLDTAIDCCGLEGTVVELSWYGERPTTVHLGGAFHSQRIRLVSSQVGHVSAGRRPRWDYARRLAAALELLADPCLDALVAGDVSFDRLAEEMPRILAPDAAGLAPVVRY